MHNKRQHHNKGYCIVIMSDVYSSRELPRLTTRIASEINAWSNTEIHHFNLLTNKCKYNFT